MCNFLNYVPVVGDSMDITLILFGLAGRQLTRFSNLFNIYSREPTENMMMVRKTIALSINRLSRVVRLGMIRCASTELQPVYDSEDSQFGPR